MKTPHASIVTASHDHSPDLITWFTALARQTATPTAYEVALTNPDYPIDHRAALEEVLATHPDAPRMETRRIAGGGRASALNDAIAHTTGEVVIFLGDDFIPGSGFVDAHLRFHDDHPEVEAVGVGLAFLTPEYRTPYGTWLEQSGQLVGIPLRREMKHVPDHFFYVGNASVKRELLRRAGPLDERFPAHAWDDFELGQRLRKAGMRSTLVPEAVVEHHHHLEQADREATMQEAGTAARIYQAIHPEDPVAPETANWPVWRHAIRLLRARIQASLLPGRATRQWCWRARLDAAFAKGYRKSGERLVVDR